MLPETTEKTQDKLIVDTKKRRYVFEVPKTKNELVKEILKRWWYGLPTWPNPDPQYYNEMLIKNKLREVEYDKFINEPEEINNFKKVYRVESFIGVYLDSKVM